MVPVWLVAPFCLTAEPGQQVERLPLDDFSLLHSGPGETAWRKKGVHCLPQAVENAQELSRTLDSVTRRELCSRSCRLLEIVGNKHHQVAEGTGKGDVHI